MIRYKVQDYLYMTRLRRQAFQEIAKQLGPTHTITQLMGSRAWGRDNFEQGPNKTLAGAIREQSAADGAFEILNRWARDHDLKAQQIMNSIYPRGFGSAP